MSGVATSPLEVATYASCTMLAASMAQDAQALDAADSDPDLVKDSTIQACIRFLQDSEFITLRKVKDKGRLLLMSSTEVS